jgi:hypothetical protein
MNNAFKFHRQSHSCQPPGLRENRWLIQVGLSMCQCSIASQIDSSILHVALVCPTKRHSTPYIVHYVRPEPIWVLD